MMTTIRANKFIAFLILCFTFNSVFADTDGVMKAQIISVTPVTDEVLVIKSNCENGTPTISASNSSWVNPSSVIGSIIGGLLGRSVGSGSGKTAATITGAVVGGVIANAVTQVPNNKYEHIPTPCSSVKTYEPVPGGFEIVYDLNGVQYSTRSAKYPSESFIYVKMAPTPVQ